MKAQNKKIDGRSIQVPQPLIRGIKSMLRAVRKQKTVAEILTIHPQTLRRILATKRANYECYNKIIHRLLDDSLISPYEFALDSLHVEKIN